MDIVNMDIVNNENQIINEKNEIINQENIINSNSMHNIDCLINIKQIIEGMDKVHHIEILKLLQDDNNVIFNENNNGTFINLTDLDNNTIKKLEYYIEYFKKQQNQLSNLENKKKQIENSFFN